MVKLAANLTMLFGEYPFLERFDRAALAGFQGVEFLFPYTERASDIRDALARNSLDLVLFNLPAGDWESGDRGLAADPARGPEFDAGLTIALEYAVALRPPRINCLVGKVDEGVDFHDTLVRKVRTAADALRATNTRLLVEPVNSLDVTGFAIDTTESALALLADAGRDNLGLQYDVYHSLRMDEDPHAIFAAHGAELAHIQIADVPGRHQPGTGSLDFPALFAAIDASGYEGWVSLEYIPEGPTESGFDLVRGLGLLG